MKHKNRVCHISTVHSLYDTRIMYRECKTLFENGKEVYLIIQNDRDDEIMGVKIKAIKKTKNRFARIFKTTFTAFKKAIKLKANIYHFHDPELIPVGILLRLMGKKVIYDVHENLPSQILYKAWLGGKSIRRVVSFFMNGIEKFSCLFFNRIVSAEPELAKRFNPKKTVTIRNLPLFTLIKNIKPAEIDKTYPVLIYAGGLTKVRGIKEIIEATEYVKNRVKLILLGKWESDEFKKNCMNLKGWQNVEYKGFVKPEEVYSFMKASDIGLALLHPEKNHITSLPIKIFEYACSGLPQIVSDFPYFKENFKDFALFANPNKPSDIASQVDLILKNKNIRKKLINNAITLTKENLSWEKEKDILINLYESL